MHSAFVLLDKPIHVNLLDKVTNRLETSNLWIIFQQVMWIFRSLYPLPIYIPPVWVKKGASALNFEPKVREWHSVILIGSWRSLKWLTIIPIYLLSSIIPNIHQIITVIWSLLMLSHQLHHENAMSVRGWHGNSARFTFYLRGKQG